MYIVFNFAFNFWHTIDVNGLKQQVQRGAITADEFKNITNTDYVAPVTPATEAPITKVGD